MKHCFHCKRIIWFWQDVYEITLDTPIKYYHSKCGFENIEKDPFGPIGINTEELDYNES